MRAAVLHAAGSALVVEDVELESPRDGEVLVRVEAAGVCHTDLHYMNGDLMCPTPVVLGHEGAGIVEAVGAGVTRVSAGDRVVLMWRPRCGQCAYCTTGRPALCTAAKVQASTGGLLDGTSRLSLDGDPVRHFLGVSCFAERCVVAEQSVVRVPAGTPSRIAALLGCAVITGVGAVLNAAPPLAGKALLIVGAGGVGLSAVMGARLAGAHPVVVADLAADKLDLARRLGASHLVDVSVDDLAAQVQEISPGGVDVAIEAVGRPESLEQALSCLRPAGTLVAVGLGRTGATFAVPVNELVQREKRVVGSLYGSANTVTEIPRLLRLYEAGRLPLDELLGRSYSLEAVGTAYAALAGGAVGRAVVLPVAPA